MKDALELKIQGIKCDNPNCDFEDKAVKVEDYDKWLNKRCPKCGANLLTKADMTTTKILMGVIKAANKILPKRKDDEKIVEGEIKMNGTGKIDFDIKVSKSGNILLMLHQYMV